MIQPIEYYPVLLDSITITQPDPNQPTLRRITFNAAPDADYYIFWKKKSPASGEYEIFHELQCNPGQQNIFDSYLEDNISIKGVGFNSYVPSNAPDIPDVKV